MENKEKPIKIVLDQKDVETMDKSFRDFNSGLKNQVEKLKEVNADFCAIQDSKEGIILETQSRKFDTLELLNMGLQAYGSILERRKAEPSKIPSGVG